MVNKKLADREKLITEHLNRAVDDLTPEAAGLLLTILHDPMQAILERHIAAHLSASRLSPRSRTGGIGTVSH